MKFRKKLSLIKIEPKQILKNLSVKGKVSQVESELSTRERKDDFEIFPENFFQEKSVRLDSLDGFEVIQLFSVEGVLNRVKEDRRRPPTTLFLCPYFMNKEGIH